MSLHTRAMWLTPRVRIMPATYARSGVRSVELDELRAHAAVPVGPVAAVDDAGALARASARGAAALRRHAGAARAAAAGAVAEEARPGAAAVLLALDDRPVGRDQRGNRKAESHEGGDRGGGAGGD